MSIQKAESQAQYVACFCCQIPVFLLLGYYFHEYAFKYPDQTACWASDASDVPTAFQVDENQENMAAVFSTWFLIGFILSVLSIMQVVCVFLLIKTKDCLFGATYTVLMFVIAIGHIAQLLMGSLDRFTHNGKVCAGAYATSETDLLEGPYLLKAGRFMKVYLIGLWIFTFCIIGALGACLRKFF